jgi:hypothetical protein
MAGIWPAAPQLRGRVVTTRTKARAPTAASRSWATRTPRLKEAMEHDVVHSAHEAVGAGPDEPPPAGRRAVPVAGTDAPARN